MPRDVPFPIPGQTRERLPCEGGWYFYAATSFRGSRNSVGGAPGVHHRCGSEERPASFLKRIFGHSIFQFQFNCLDVHYDVQCRHEGHGRHVSHRIKERS